MKTLFKVTLQNPNSQRKHVHIFQNIPTLADIQTLAEKIEYVIPISELPKARENWQIVSLEAMLDYAGITA